MVKTANDRKSERTGSDCVLGIPFIYCGSPNEAGACVIATWRLGLRSPLVARHKIIIIFLIQRWLKTRERWSPKFHKAWKNMKAEKVVHCTTGLHDMTWYDKQGGKVQKRFQWFAKVVRPLRKRIAFQTVMDPHTKNKQNSNNNKKHVLGVFRQAEAPTCVRTFYAMPDDSKDQTSFCQKMIVCTLSFNIYFALRAAGQVLILLFFESNLEFFRRCFCICPLHLVEVKSTLKFLSIVTLSAISFTNIWNVQSRTQHTLHSLK